VEKSRSELDSTYDVHRCCKKSFVLSYIGEKQAIKCDHGMKLG